MSFMIMDLDKETDRAPRRVKRIPGVCVGCGEKVYEADVTLSDAYAVWAGKCPYCQAINLLSTKHGRGYDSSRMYLVSPTPGEIAEYPELASTRADMK